MFLFQNRVLYPASAFISGFAVMVVELTAARIIAPFVGASVYTWTAVIGTVLLGLAVGSYLGGWWIDKRKSDQTLSLFLFLSATLVALIPLISNKTAEIALFDLSILKIVLLISAVLFLPSAVFLGCLYPAILKLYSRSIENIGKQSGIISALWTFGSIAGTFLTGFYFIGAVGSANTFFITAAVLFLMSVLFFFRSGKPGSRTSAMGFCAFGTAEVSLPGKPVSKNITAIFLAAILTLAIFFPVGAKKQNKNIIFDSESDYYAIKVVDGEFFGAKSRFLFLDFDSHSIERLDGEDLNIYTNIYPVFSVFKEDIKDIFVIGGGSYSIAKKFSVFYENSKVTVSEIDPEVTKAAENFFNLKKYPIKTVSEDARIFLRKTGEKYDVIFEDAFNSFISLPWHLTTFEFNELAKSHLKPGGVYAVNFISALEGENSLFFQSMLKTFRKTFDNFYVFAYGATRQAPQSIILIGVNSDDKIGYRNLIKKISKIKNGSVLFYKAVPPDSLADVSEARILTDDFAPVENLTRPLMNNYFDFYSKFYYSIVLSSVL